MGEISSETSVLALTEAEPLCPVVIVEQPHQESVSCFSHTHRDRSVVGGGCSCRQTGRGVGAELRACRRVRNVSNGSERRFCLPGSTSCVSLCSL